MRYSGPVETAHRPELATPVRAFAQHLARGVDRIPMVDLAALFGAQPDVLEAIARRGDIELSDGTFTNDGPELVIPAGRVEIEVPSLLRGTYSSEDGGFSLAFPQPDFTLRACVTLLVFRKCFDLQAMRATSTDMVLDFGGGPADRRFTFGSPTTEE
ncbi:MAG: hypothetical protein ACE10D_03890 [Planctomycetota bacterium]|nr:hypothetical protein [Planctomycetota bacterium]